jgi:hypothetical protein
MIWSAVILVLTLLQLPRQAGIPAWRTLFAEDGRVFLAGAPDLASLMRGNVGYEHLLPRLIALGSVPVPAAWLARYFAFVPALVTAALSAAVWPLSASLVPSRTLRAILVASVAFVPAAVDENLASATYLIWPILFVCYWALIARPQTGLVLALAGAVAFLGAASNLLALLFVPLALWLGWTRRDRMTLTVLGAFAAGLMLQVVVALSSSAQPNGTSLVNDIPPLYAVRVLGSALFGEKGTQALWAHGGYGYALAVAVVVGAGLAFLAVRTARDARILGLITLAYSFMAFAVPVFIRGTETIRLTAGEQPGLAYGRFATMSILLLMSGGFILLVNARLGQGVNRWLVLTVAAYFAVLVVAGYRQVNERSDGPEWRAALHAAQVSCRTEDRSDVAIPISPPGWSVRLPCDRIV